MRVGVVVALVVLVAASGCARLKRLVSDGPSPRSRLYFGAVDMPDAPAVADTRHDPATWARVSGGAISQNACVEVSEEPRWRAVGRGDAFRLIAGYVTWF